MTIQTMEKKRQNVRQKIAEKDAALAPKMHTNQPISNTLTEKDAIPGTSVHVISMNLDGTITIRPDSRGFVSVQCGIITSKVRLNDLVRAEVVATPEKKGHGKVNISKASNISPEIKVIGMTVDEALAVIDKHLDDAYLCHLPKVRIVHGKGTGALRNGIHAYLRTCPYVSSFALAAHGEGDAGVTVVEFK